MAVVFPASILNEAFSRIGFYSASWVGYLKVTFVNLISLFRLRPTPFLTFGLFLISGVLSMTSKTSLPKVLAWTRLCTFGRAAMTPTKPVIRAIRTESTSFWSYG